MKNGTLKIGFFALTAGLLIAGTAYANGARGGASDLISLSGERPTIAEKATAKARVCSSCTTESKVVSVPDNKARVLRAVPTATHGCPTCKTTSILVGHGKAKVEKRSHGCAAAPETLVCCTK
jgi:hypothetical protein